MDTLFSQLGVIIVSEKGRDNKQARTGAEVHNMYSEHIDDCIMAGIERELKAERDAEKAKAKVDILDTEKSINYYLAKTESLELLNRIADRMHDTEDILKLVIGEDIRDAEKIREESRYGEW